MLSKGLQRLLKQKTQLEKKYRRREALRPVMWGKKGSTTNDRDDMTLVDVTKWLLEL